jgi:hypothetical protein
MEYNKQNLKVFFTNQIDSESRGIEVFLIDSFKDKIFLTKGHLNLCTNIAYVDILEEKDQWKVDKGLLSLRCLEDKQKRIKTAIENRNIIDNKIFN